MPTSAVEAAATPHLTIIASGLDNPRGIAFGPEGALFVAEAGRGGPACTSVVLFGAPMCYGRSGAVTRVAHGEQRRVATGLGSFAHLDGGFAFGVSVVAVEGVGSTYVTVGGCFGFISPAEGKCGGLFLNPDGSRATLLSEGLQYPTGVAVHDGAVYISNCGTCPGTGQVLRFSFGDTQ